MSAPAFEAALRAGTGGTFIQPVWSPLSRVPRNALVALRQPVDRWRFRRRLRGFHRDLVRPGDLVFDIGANVGDYTAAFLELDARVVAVEPGAEALGELHRRFDRDERVAIVPTGLSDSEGVKQLYVSTEGGSPLTTMSPEWISAAQESGRFSQFRWRPAGEVEVTTLDSLIELFGTPAFVKIDVEGLELPVVRGLSAPVPGVSLEYHPEYRAETVAAIGHLNGLAAAEFMYVPGSSVPAIGKSMPGTRGEWLGFDELCERLATATGGEWGDVLVRSGLCTAASST
jgi:FkbM family methyltransferase